MCREHPAQGVPQLRWRARPATDPAGGPARGGPAIDPSRGAPRLRRDLVSLTSWRDGLVEADDDGEPGPQRGFRLTPASHVRQPPTMAATATGPPPPGPMAPCE